ncbi:metallophosphoesterase [Nocardioides bruguierae]|uniref:metallophosphoesterase n=1 Tax=Nocardioides bruguierae TaxID=2945102 RepID=UPI0027E1FB22|nr:metallophosphoesterase [Nocardioides bruguierae]
MRHTSIPAPPRLLRDALARPLPTPGPAVLAGLGLAAAGGAALAAGAAEARRYTLRRHRLAGLPAGADPIRVLHLSDIHLTPGQERKRDWLTRLSALPVDLVVNTGDNLSHQRAVGPLVEALGPLLDAPGVFVLGSNDYFEPRVRNPFQYLLPDTGKRRTDVPELPWRHMAATFTGRGWLDLTNTTGRLSVKGVDLAFAGVDDPHLAYDDLAAVDDAAPVDAGVRLAVAHAPYLRVLDHFAQRGWDAILAGHTHGGQVCLPNGRALTTNCDLDNARARGLHRHPADSRPGDPASSWLHVCAGLGTSPFARVRVACRPEAVLLTLEPVA